MAEIDLDIVIPVFNEIEIVEQLHTRVVAACDSTQLSYRIIYVDDGSCDGTRQWIKQNAISHRQSGSRDLISIGEPKTNQGQISLVELSRNFGQPAAIHAGLQQSNGRCVVIMDGDLQDPPELVPEMVERWKSGEQVVIAQRSKRDETILRGLAFKAFHSVFRYLSDSDIPPNTGTFCLLDRVAANSICNFPESHRFFPGLRAAIGYKQSVVTFARPPRAGGKPKQTFGRLFKYALDAIFGFSFKPIRILTGGGILACAVSLCFMIWTVFSLTAGSEVESVGLTILTAAAIGLGGIQLIGLGILGEYIGRIYDEVKARPQFVVADQFHSRGTQTELSRSPEVASNNNNAMKINRRIAG